MINPQMWKLIQRYITDNCSPEERSRIEQWIDEDSRNRQLVHDLEQIWELSPDEEFQVNVKDAWDQFRIREIIQRRSVAEQKPPSVASGRMLTIFRAAAAILLVVFAGFFSWQYLSKQGTAEEKVVQEQMQDIETQNGEKAQVSFSDGTTVTLNTASSLRYPKQFNGSKREVYLTGEAYFEVVSNTDKSFVVHTNTADVEVLGTKFNIRAWEEETAVSVGVREGKVAVSSSDSTRKQDENRVLLTKGQFTSVIKGKGVTGVQNVDVDKYLLWLNGGMYFDSVPFKQVFLQIERRFNVQIAVKDKSILEVPFTSTFRDRELSKILRVLAASMKMEYRQEGNNIEFYKP